MHALYILAALGIFSLNVLADILVKGQPDGQPEVLIGDATYGTDTGPFDTHAGAWANLMHDMDYGKNFGIAGPDIHQPYTDGWNPLPRHGWTLSIVVKNNIPLNFSDHPRLTNDQKKNSVVAGGALRLLPPEILVDAKLSQTGEYSSGHWRLCVTTFFPQSQDARKKLADDHGNCNSVFSPQCIERILRVSEGHWKFPPRESQGLKHCPAAEIPEECNPGGWVAVTNEVPLRFRRFESAQIDWLRGGQLASWATEPVNRDNKSALYAAAGYINPMVLTFGFHKKLKDDPDTRVPTAQLKCPTVKMDKSGIWESRNPE